MEHAITVKNLTKTYGTGDTAVHALNDCNIAFADGKLTAITGTSGSGKSTLLNLLGGLTSAESGTIYYGDTDLLKLDDRRLAKFRRRNIGFVFQFFNLIPELTAKENILLPIRIDGQKPDFTYFEQLTEKLGIAGRLTHYPQQLSGGQQQRTAIARALIGKPRVVLCDEPTGNLDRRSGQEVLSLLRTIQQEYQQTIIMVTHDLNIAHAADCVIQIEDGRIVPATL